MTEPWRRTALSKLQTSQPLLRAGEKTPVKQGWNYLELKAITWLTQCPAGHSLRTHPGKRPRRFVTVHGFCPSDKIFEKRKCYGSRFYNTFSYKFNHWLERVKSKTKQKTIETECISKWEIIKRAIKRWEVFFSGTGGENYATFHYADFCNWYLLRRKYHQPATWELLWEPWKGFSFAHICLHLLSVCCRFRAG